MLIGAVELKNMDGNLSLCLPNAKVDMHHVSCIYINYIYIYIYIFE